MAARKKTGGKDFQPGQSGNPNGRPVVVSDELREAKKHLREQFELTVIECTKLTFPELDRLIQDQMTPALKLMVASVMVKGVSLGDPVRMTFFLDRLVGPVPKAVELSGAQGQPLSPLLNFTSIELTSMLGEIQKLIKDKGCSPQKQVSPSASSQASLPRGSRTGS